MASNDNGKLTSCFCAAASEIWRRPLSHITLNAVTDICVCSGLGLTLATWNSPGDLGSALHLINGLGIGAYFGIRWWAENNKAQNSATCSWAPKAPLIAQIGFQAAALVATWHYKGEMMNPLDMFIIYGSSFASNLAAFFDRGQSGQAVSSERLRLSAILKNTRRALLLLFKNTYFYLGISLSYAGHVWGGHSVPVSSQALGIIAESMYLVAVAKTMLKAIPEIKRVFTDTKNLDSQQLNHPGKNAFLQLMDDKDAPILLLAAGCACAAAENYLQHNTFKGVGMLFYSAACLSFYAYRKWGGVAELVDVVVEKVNQPKRSALVAPSAFNNKPPIG